MGVASRPETGVSSVPRLVAVYLAAVLLLGLWANVVSGEEPPALPTIRVSHVHFQALTAHRVIPPDPHTAVRTDADAKEAART